MPRQIVIGCSVRPDNSGGGSASDMRALQACQQLFSTPIRVGDDTAVEIEVVVRKVPMVATPSDAGAVQSARSAFLVPAKGMDAARTMDANLAGVDLLYIPGAPAAPTTQQTDTHKMKPASAFKKTEAVSRDAFESALIEAAMTRGIPILAVCAGSWRLLEGFGGAVRELSGEDVKRHYEGSWNCNHPLAVRPGEKGILNRSALKTNTKTGVFPGANSTHWAVAATTTTGALAKHGNAETRASHAFPAPRERGEKPAGMGSSAQRNWRKREDKAILKEHADASAAFPTTPGRAFRDPADLLQVMVREGTRARLGTVEGYESNSGAPVVGVQWHPESFMPGMKGPGEKYANDDTIAFSRNIFMNMVLAALASQTRRSNVIPALKEAFQKEGMGLRKASEDQKAYTDGYFTAIVPYETDTRSKPIKPMAH